MEFGLAPGGACCERVVRDVFTTADHGARGRQVTQLFAESKCAVETPGEALLTSQLWLHRTRLRLAARSRESGNLPLDKRLFKPADAGELTYTRYARHGALLQR